MLLKISIRLLLLFPILVAAQNQEDHSKIDSLLVKAQNAYAIFEDTKCLEYAKQASTLAFKIGDNQREAQGYFLMARVLATMEMQKESMLYAKKAEVLGYAKGNKILLAELKEIKSFNYRSLGLNSHAAAEDKSIIALLKSTTDVNSLMIQARVYGNIGSYYYDIKQPDSALAYLKKEENILQRIPENRVVLQYSEFLDAKGYIHLDRNQLDSAFYYFEKGYVLKQKHKDPLLYIQYCAFGDYYKAKGDIGKALEFYLKTVQNIKEHDVRNSNYTNVYKTISELYGMLKQSDKETLYLKKYTQINDSIHLLKERKTDHVVHVLLKEKEADFNYDKKNLIGIIAAICLMGTYIFYFINKKYRKAKETSKKNKRLVIQNEHENKDLKLKLNESFEELMMLAKTNHSGFYTRFQEVYPEFQKKLLQINPDLQIPELTLSAYIYLDFPAKEIAEYTFKSFRTIQNRKNRLRKKLYLDSSEDLSVWFKNLVSTA